MLTCRVMPMCWRMTGVSRRNVPHLHAAECQRRQNAVHGTMAMIVWRTTVGLG